MQINVQKINRMLWIIGIVIVVAAGVAYFFLNEAQRYVVGVGLVLGLLNLLGLSFFFNKNNRQNRRRR